MAVVVFDDFNRANDPTGLGTATTGQVWALETGAAGAFTVNTNQALWTWHYPTATGRTLIESGLVDGITTVTMVNPTSGTSNFGVGFGFIFRWVNSSYSFRLVYYKFAASPAINRLRLEQTWAGITTGLLDINVTLADGDTISATYCGTQIEVFVNGVSKGTHTDTQTPTNYGTKCGLIGISGSYFTTITKRYDNFTVETNDACSGGDSAVFVIPATRFAMSATATSQETETLTFDNGTGSSWYITLPISDAGNELRSHVLKALHATGKFTNAELMAWGYDVSTPINVTDLEDGTNSTTGALALTNTTWVTQSPRIQINVPNSVLSTIRISGDDTGQSTRDEVHEIDCEWAEQGVRR